MRRHRLADLTLAALALLGVACGAASSKATGPGATLPTTAYAIELDAMPAGVPGSVAVHYAPVASGLAEPWGLAFLPDGRMLVTEKGGTLQLLAAGGASRAAVSGLPAVAAAGQGGLLDVAVDPAFARNRRVYLTYAEPGTFDEAGLAGTAVYRAELDDAGPALRNGAVIFRQAPKVAGSGHFGARLAFGRDGALFVTMGERQQGAPAQDVTVDLGKVVRLDTDGHPAAGNPVLGTGARPELWTMGHRNPQATALHPDTGELWVAEHGPQGGDEVNLALPGRNFGWPVVSYGCNYGDPVGTACRIGGGVHAPAFTEPLAFWYPTSTAPGGMAFYAGSAFPEWRGDLFVGGLAARTLWRLRLAGAAVVAHQPLLRGEHELRDVRLGPDGFLYVLTRDSGELLRVER